MEETKTEKKGTNPLVMVGIGCFVLLVILGLASSFVMKFFAKKVGIGLLQGAIENKTGVKTNLQDLEQGKMSFTDNKTGAKVDIGSGKVPDSFPKDFPLYPGAKVVSSLSGAQQGKNNGFWLTFSTSDSLDKVTSFYKNQFAANQWDITTTYTAGDTTSQTVTKGTWSGSVAITGGSSGKETTIIIILGQEEKTSTPTPTDTPTNTGSSY